MNENLAAMMFDFLKERVGEEVSCTKWTYGIRMECEGVLEEVVPFEKVMISKSIIPFVGDRQAIESISLKKNGSVIYSNPKVENYDRKGEEVALAQEEMLGYSVARNGLYGGKQESKEKYH